MDKNKMGHYCRGSQVTEVMRCCDGNVAIYANRPTAEVAILYAVDLGDNIIAEKTLVSGSLLESSEFIEEVESLTKGESK